MATIVTHFRVKDYAKWRRLFDKLAPTREEYGIESSRVLRSLDDPSELTVISEVRSSENVREALDAYSQVPEAKAGLEHFVEPPTTHLLTDAD